MAHELTADYFEDEDLLEARGLAEVASRCAARLALDEEEATAVHSTRPTMAVFHGEPWL